MANMSYCRFENTYQDLKDCYAHLDDPDLSPTEQRYRTRLLALALEIVNVYGEGVRDQEED